MVEKFKRWYDGIASWLIPMLVTVLCTVLSLAVVFGKSLNQIAVSKQDIEELKINKADKEMMKMFFDEVKELRKENREDHIRMEKELSK